MSELKRHIGQKVALASVAFLGACAGVLYVMNRPQPLLPEDGQAKV